MDTPQVTPAILAGALADLLAPSTDAVLGPCEDGGYWGIGLMHADPRVFEGVPMSTERTAEFQLRRMETLGLRTALLPLLRDVDRHEDAVAVARQAPASGFALALARSERHLDRAREAA